jgi:rhamnosyltransferase
MLRISNSSPGVPPEAFAPQAKRAAVFAHFNPIDRVEEYVLYYLKELSTVANHIVFVSTSKISKNDRERLKKHCKIIIEIPNKGYDFISYKTGLNALDISAFDEIIICNDSVYGPLTTLSNIFTKMSKLQSDFWGITDSNEFSYHLQSYFIVFKKSLFSTEVFRSFWNDVKVLENKQEIIEKYELGLTQRFIHAGFSCQTVVSAGFSKWKQLAAYFSRVRWTHILKVFPYPFYHLLTQDTILHNITHYFWKEILQGGGGFVKIEPLRTNPKHIKKDQILTYISKCTDYDTAMITSHLLKYRKQSNES